jgi:hypothetical protein
MDKIFYTRHDGGLTLFKSGKHSTVANSHPNFARILDSLKRRAFGEVEALMNVGTTITKLGVSRKFKDRKVYVEKGEIFWIDSKKVNRKLEGPLVDRILKSIGTKAGDKFADALLLFLDNLQKNKLKDMRQEMYDWLMSGEAPITYDGCFLAYKKVRRDFKDIHSGRMDNSPGAVVRMPQDQVDRDRNNECSVGLHFCSRGYLSSYAGDDCHVVIVKVNPRHVFAIPRDYNHQKGRASEYFVVGTFKGDWKNEEAFKESFVDEDSKFASMPGVEFATGWLRPSLKALGESFGIVTDGKVTVIERRGQYVPVKETVNGYVDIMGTPVNGEPREMSFETKSVREVVKRAIAKADKSGKA